MKLILSSRKEKLCFEKDISFLSNFTKNFEYRFRFRISLFNISNYCHLSRSFTLFLYFPRTRDHFIKFTSANGWVQTRRPSLVFDNRWVQTPTVADHISFLHRRHGKSCTPPVTFLNSVQMSSRMSHRSVRAECSHRVAIQLTC